MAASLSADRRSDPKPFPRRRGVLLFIFVIAEMLITTTLFFWLEQSRGGGFNPFDWHRLLVLSTVISQLFVLALFTALWEFKRSLRWLLILAILVLQSALFLLALVSAMAMQSRGFHLASLHPTILLTFLLERSETVVFVIPVTLWLGVASVLMVHSLLWPMRAVLGWQLHWRGQAPPEVRTQFTIWHMFLWTALIGALLSLIRSLSAFDSGGMTTFLLLWGIATFLGGLPGLILATRKNHPVIWIAATIAWLGLFSLCESELTFLIFKYFGGRVWIPVWIVGLFNTAVASLVLLQILALRGLGIAFELPIPLLDRRNPKPV